MFVCRDVIDNDTHKVVRNLDCGLVYSSAGLGMGRGGQGRGEEDRGMQYYA